MDDGEGHRKQHALPGYPGIPPLGTVTEGIQRPSGRAGIESSRLGPMHGAHASTSAPTLQQAATPSAYGFYDEGSHPSSLPVAPNPLHYQSEEPTYQTRQSSVPQYGSGIVYSLAQQIPQNPPPYDPVLHYQHHRRPAGMELPTQFVNVQPFYVPNEPITTTAAVPTQHVSSTFPSLAFPQQTPAGQSTMAPAYAPPMSDLSQGTASQQPQHHHQQQQQQQQHQQHQQQQAAASEYGQAQPNYEAAYNWYQANLKRTFEQIHAGQLADAGQTLLDISDWFLTHAAELGKAIPRFQEPPDPTPSPPPHATGYWGC